MTFRAWIRQPPITVRTPPSRCSRSSRWQRSPWAPVGWGSLSSGASTLSIEEINQDREKFLKLVNENVGTELAKIGLDVINVNIRDITDESGYIAAIGKKAAAEAVNQARIEVAQAEQMGAIGESEAVRIKQVAVALQNTGSIQGQKGAERDQRVALAAMEAKADGYRKLITACGDRPDMAPTLLMIEKLTEVVAEQVKAVQNLKIDKITVWDSGNGEGGGTAGFLSGLIGSLPAMHDLAKQAGIKLPEFFGSVDQQANAKLEVRS